jgi:RNA polymerase subunit RPABC4/transcription elongation factor Spt4
MGSAENNCIHCGYPLPVDRTVCSVCGRKNFHHIEEFGIEDIQPKRQAPAPARERIPESPPVPSPIPVPPTRNPGTIEQAVTVLDEKHCSKCGFPVQGDKNLCPVCEDQNHQHSIPKVPFKKIMFRLGIAWSIVFLPMLILALLTIVNGKHFSPKSIVVIFILVFLPWIIYFIFKIIGNTNNKNRLINGLLFAILSISIFAFLVNNGTIELGNINFASSNNSDPGVQEAITIISRETGIGGSGQIVDQFKMSGANNDILWVDYLIEVKSQNKYYYVVHREGGGSIPSFTRATTYPCSLVPVRNQRILRGILNNG